MAQKIDQDLQRFRQIVRGKIKKQLRRFISTGELIGKKGNELVSIPIPRITIPHFEFSDKQQNGVGQGDGGDGEPVGPGDGGGKAGNTEGKHSVEVEVDFEQLAELLGEELELPRIEPKGEDQLESGGLRYSSLASAGPESLRHSKRTFRKALKRQIASSTYDPLRPIIIPVREDRVYRSAKVKPKQKSKALIVYILDVSGSMGNEQKEIVRLTSFWIDTWLRSQYPGVDVRYIIHDAVAKDVDRETFFHTRESGGTIISSAYKLLLRLIDEEYDPNEWNIYPFQFSDGDNWSGNDTEECLKILNERILPISNMFCYGQVESEYGSGQFLQDLLGRFKEDERVVTAKIPGRESISSAIKTFLGKGK
ncbi:MAG: hypothetical protein COX62_05005 [Deltaproteobacteria bacterium CG_4_10_14_0_2_um_filter_43_8]|nr:MAG: hypothetical protein COV43_05505 [Deltaproteobacteria bacterium CG11_big_fil_rev_8_21_14_0_20_42_23]PJA20266.1 MAG: hypothetical protein COX62_05005 [Deltaproteobacteria bacterium CG_4_10_14_0_2_um_filter_43_8]PJC64048.1 MAG: hypothetical protein CO021_06480 [Deltaproteobacteria bacterium CG_4_9_14_0_2_um_filter_42_21]